MTEAETAKLIAQRIDELVLDLNMRYTLNDLSQMLNVSRPTLNAYRRGKIIPNILFVRKLSDMTGVSSDWILGVID